DEPLPQPAQTADIRELRGVRLVREHASAIEKLVLGSEHARQVRLGERAVVEDGLTCEPLGVGNAEATQVVDEVLERFRLYAARLPAVRIRPLLRHPRD